jgi:hypothetical protein
LTEEIDESAFVDCPLTEIQVAPGWLNFKVEGTLLVTSNGTEIVRYFGLDREIIVGKNVKVLGKLCFEGLHSATVYGGHGLKFLRQVQLLKKPRSKVALSLNLV